MKSENKTMCLSEKTEYIAVDFTKLIFAFLVMMIHIQILDGQYAELNFWLVNIFCRLAVPFFFLVSGFFVAGKMHDAAKVKAYVKRILLLYIIYTIIYGDFAAVQYMASGESTIEKVVVFLKRFLFVGSYGHLWYLLAVVWAVGLLYLVLERLKWSEKKIAFLAVVLYLIGVCGNAYRNLFDGVPVVSTVFSIYESIFVTTRNGVFFGFPYIALGYFIYKYRDRIWKRNYWLYALLFLVVMAGEEYLAKCLTDHDGQSMLFMTPFVIVSLFLAGAFVRLPQKGAWIGKIARNLAFLIYVWHVFIHYKFGAELSGYTMNMAGISYFIMVAKRVVMLGGCIILLSKIKILSWLKYLY